MTVVTRFAPSPTGFLHIGGARTALFNWLYAKHHNGKFLLRIEDTDRARSTDAAVDAIFHSLKWLGLDWEGEPVFQFSRAQRHVEVANHLLATGHAYKCYCTPEDLEYMREEARKNNKPLRYNGHWRSRDPAAAPAGVSPAIRLKAPQTGQTTIHDGVQGQVTIANEELDDMVLLRSDGTPTYMLSVVVDDHDMAVTHVIRGDDHLTNTFRQYQIYAAMGWPIPIFSHIPLIHGQDGAKLSKRHGALGTDAYRDMGFLPAALCNYLLRLGWGHGDAEIISRAQAIEWFDLGGIGKAPSRLDLAKLTHINAHYMKEMDDHDLLEALTPYFEFPLTQQSHQRLLAGMAGLKIRARTLLELKDSALFYTLNRPLTLNEAAEKLLKEQDQSLLSALYTAFEENADWTEEGLENVAKTFASAHSIKLGQVAQPLRCALSGSTTSPGIFEVMRVLGREESLLRLKDHFAEGF